MRQIDIEDRSQLIGDFLIINAEILDKQFNSKLPKFMSKFIANYQRRKLIKIAKKIKKSNMIMNKDNLIELFTYIYNNFQDDNGRFGCVQKVFIESNFKYLQAVIYFDGNIASFIFEEYTTNNCKSFDLNIDCSKDPKYINNYSITKEDLSSNEISKVPSEILNRINQLLLEDMTSYIITSVSSYIS